MPVRASAARGWWRAIAAPGATGTVRVLDDRLVREDGVAVTGVQCGDLDVLALDADRRTALTAAFGRLCRSLGQPLQLLVRVRRCAPPCASAAPAATPLRDRLRSAEVDCERRLLERTPAYRRDVVVLTASPARGGPPERRPVDVVADALVAAGVEVRALDGATLGALLREAWGDASREATAETLTPPPWDLARTHLRSGDVLLRGFRLHRLPGVAVETGWLAPLLRVRAECDIAIHLDPVAVGDAMSRLSRRLRTMRADQLVELDRESFGDAGLEAGVDAALDLRDRLARNEGRPLLLSVTAVARGRDLHALAAATDALRDGFAATLSGARVAHLEHLDAAICTWPLVDDRSPDRKLVDSAAASSAVPFVEAVCDEPGGYLLGRATASLAPVRLDLFDARRHPNANVAVLAASGRGKSYAIGTLVLGAAARGIGSVIIDPEGEYEAMVRSLQGTYIHVRPGCGASLNIFDVTGAADGGDGRVGAVVSLVDTLVGGTLDDVERAVVDGAAREAVLQAADRGTVPVLGDCIVPVERGAPRLRPVLERFCSGPLGELFNRPTSMHLDAAVVGMGLRDLREELVPAATLIVAEWLWALVRRDRRERHIVFDEVGLLCAHPPLRTLLAQLARRCRKYGASLVVATQNAGDLLATEEGRVIATNPAVVLLGGHRGAETARMQDAFSLTDSQRGWLEGASRGEFLLLAGARRLGVRIEAGDLQHALLTAGR